MRRKDVTIKDIAKEAKVSTATVSRVINGHTIPGNITAKRVLEAAQKVGYTFPEKSAGCNRKTILAIVHGKNISYQDRILMGIQRAAEQMEYDVIVHTVRESNIDTKYFLRLGEKFSVSGMVFVSACVPTSIMNIIEASIPVVKCIDVMDNDDITCIGINDRNAFKAITSYLISIGRKKIGFLSAPLMGDIPKYREEGFREAMRSSSLKVNPEWVIANLQRENGEVADFNQILYIMKKLWQSPDKPDAIVCSIDTDAAMLIKAAQTLGLHVPEDIAVTGFFNLPVSRLVTPAITTVDTRASDIGFTAMKLLDERISNPMQAHTVVYTNCEIIIRESTSLL